MNFLSAIIKKENLSSMKTEVWKNQIKDQSFLVYYNKYCLYDRCILRKGVCGRIKDIVILFPLNSTHISLLWISYLFQISRFDIFMVCSTRMSSTINGQYTIQYICKSRVFLCKGYWISKCYLEEWDMVQYMKYFMPLFIERSHFYFWTKQ